MWGRQRCCCGGGVIPGMIACPPGSATIDAILPPDWATHQLNVAHLFPDRLVVRWPGSIDLAWQHTPEDPYIGYFDILSVPRDPLELCPDVLGAASFAGFCKVQSGAWTFRSIGGFGELLNRVGATYRMDDCLHGPTVEIGYGISLVWKYLDPVPPMGSPVEYFVSQDAYQYAIFNTHIRVGPFGPDEIRKTTPIHFRLFKRVGGWSPDPDEFTLDESWKLGSWIGSWVFNGPAYIQGLPNNDVFSRRTHPGIDDPGSWGYSTSPLQWEMSVYQSIFGPMGSVSWDGGDTSLDLAGRTNHSFPISVAQSDEELISSPGRPVYMHPLLLPTDCDNSCFAGCLDTTTGLVIDAFPNFAAIELVEGFEFGPPHFGQILSDSFVSNLGDQAAVLGTSCDGGELRHNQPTNYRATSWFLNNPNTIDFYMMEYHPGSEGFLNNSPLALFIGRVRISQDDDPDPVYQLFTEAAITVLVDDALIGGQTFYCTNLGPTYRESEFTAAELATYAQVDNAFGWLHDWDFTGRDWYMNIIGPWGGVREYSFDPEKYKVSLVPGMHGIEELEDYCIPTDQAVQFSGRCAIGDNWKYRFAANGLAGTHQPTEHDMGVFATYEP